MAGNVYKRVNGAWVADIYYQYQQNTATVENSKTIPIYSDGSNLTDYSFEGQCSQASTPTPSSPVEVQEFGNQIPDIGALNAIGEYIDSLNLATGLYSHKIKQIIFDGSENWTNAGIAGLSRMSIALSDTALVRDSVCSHYIYDPDNLNVNNHCFITSTLGTFMFCDNTNATDLTKWTTFLATQYSNGTPLTVWYILATPTTETLTIGSGLSGIEEGYTIQTGTPTPSSPQMPQTNDIGGKTIIQITSAGQTQNIILSEPLCKKDNYADSLKSEGAVTRKIGKYEFTGDESWMLSGGNLFCNALDSTAASSKAVISSHFISSSSSGLYVSVGENRLKLFANSFPTGVTDSNSMKTWLAQQYANGTPVTVYYVLATPIIESYSRNLFTPAAAQTTTLNSVTCVSDGKGRYSLSGTASAVTSFEFIVPEFTVPESVGNGGTGTFSIFNDFTQQYISLRLYNDSTKVTEWSCNSQNRTSTTYSEMSNKTVNKIVIRVSDGVSISGTVHLSPMITNDSTLPLTFDAYKTMPTIPTSSGYSNIEIGTSLAPSKFTYDLGKMFVGKGQGKVRVNGEWV